MSRESNRNSIAEMTFVSSGILLMDKPVGMSSAKMVHKVKKMIGAKKVGHTGSLDPFATGVLILCVNKATRLADFFLKGEKKYRAVLRLGVSTDTQDATGSIIKESDPSGVTCKDLESVCAKYFGNIDQVPPVYSALKHKGVPLYKLARKGAPVQKPARKVRISALAIDEVNMPDVTFSVTCSAGTYIRTLASDMGDSLGCGGHLTQLRRTDSCGFSVEKAFTLERLEETVARGDLGDALIPMAEALKYTPGVVGDNCLKKKIKHGATIEKDDLAVEKTDESGLFKIVDSENNLLAVLKKDNDNYKYCSVFIN